MGRFAVMSFRGGKGAALIAFAFVSVLAGLAAGDGGVQVEGSLDGGVKQKVEPLVKEIERLRHHVGGLDSALQQKDAHIATIEKEIALFKEREHERGGGGGGKSEDDALSKLQSEVESMAVKVKLLEDRAAAAAREAEQAHRYAEALKKRAESAEEKLRDLESKLEKSESLRLDSKTRTKEMEKALKEAEVTVLEAEKRLQAHGEELSRVHKMWLPPWAAAHLAIVQSRVKAKWLSHVKPGVETAYHHASKGAADARAFVTPHFAKVGPAAQQQWEAFSKSVAPHVELVKSKSRDGFETFKKDYVGKTQEYLQPHVDAVVETGRPYVSYVQERTRPVVNQVVSVSKPYLEHARSVAGPYIEQAPTYYRNAISTAAQQHSNLQDVVRTHMNKHESLAAIATREVIWLLASFIVALAVVPVLLLCSSAVKRKPVPRKSSPGPAGHKHKRAKKADK